MAHGVRADINPWLLIVPSLFEAFGWAAAFKTLDAHYDHRQWMGYGISAIVLIVGGVIWLVLWARLTELWPWRKLRIALAENTALKAQLEESKASISSTLSKLAIHSAKYSARRRGDVYDVTDCLRQMIRGDSLVLQIQNGNFCVGDKNFVPKDPCEGKKKWLDVEYSFNGGVPAQISRREDYRMVLPEDTQVKQVIEELEAKVPLLSPLQIEALQFRNKIQGFLDEYGPRRTVKAEDFPDTPEGILAFNRERDKEERPGGYAFHGAFTLRFGADAKTLYYKFIAAGVTKPTDEFGSLAEAVNAKCNIEDLIRMLWEMAGKLNTNSP